MSEPISSRRGQWIECPGQWFVGYYRGQLCVQKRRHATQWGTKPKGATLRYLADRCAALLGDGHSPRRIFAMLGVHPS